MKALAVFHDDAKGFWPEHVCRPGFRHCYAVVDDGDHWIMVDGGSKGPEIQVMASSGFELAAFWRELGWTVVETETRAPRHLNLWPFMIGSCVSTTKRTLGIAAPFVLTPHQLYRHLTKRN